MLKPLELTIYPLMPTAESLAPLTRDEAFRELKRASALNQQIVDKRFTNAELAAEYWSSCARIRLMTRGISGYSRHGARADVLSRRQAARAVEWERAETLHRFAILPHYDEEVTQ